MTLKEVLKKLESFGTEQNRKIYLRHGAGPKLYGVSFANLKKLTKEIKIDHELALQLWNTRNTDAQTLALMIAAPEKMTKATAQKWIQDISYYGLGNLLGTLLAQTDFAKEIMYTWMASKQEFVKHCGYDICSTILKNNPERLSNAEAQKILRTIEKEIHSSPNRARNGMNWCLIAIGGYKLEKEAIAVARRIGKVEVDHGETNCVTPDAESYIKKVKAHRPPLKPPPAAHRQGGASRAGQARRGKQKKK
ncbi:DNA alkylation repair protein [Candidatus Peregrinibacteria bacterium CG11_big_fil_rev_8_21_14_0_20_46_8]|nr:MAG: DNA alkylation repair protein [Candidatus Peregrinibacteria bacterium CG11_big_fil_rev_8_21_14_0_20_46_8]